jgi:hypothetical protein
VGAGFLRSIRHVTGALKQTQVCFIIGQRVGSLSRAAFYEVIKERKGKGVEGIGLLTVINE